MTILRLGIASPSQLYLLYLKQRKQILLFPLLFDAIKIASRAHILLTDRATSQRLLPLRRTHIRRCRLNHDLADNGRRLGGGDTAWVCGFVDGGGLGRRGQALEMG